MKRGKDEEKSMGPMFPRLHVNDTDKGGPRAPPRNKMALYEQLSIPSQRFSGGALPLNTNSTPNYVSLPPSSSQGCVSERGSFFPLQQPPSMHAADKTNNRHSDLNSQLVQQEQKKKPEQDDFRVPIFVQQPGASLHHSGNHQNRDNEGPSPFSSAISGHVPTVQKASERNKSQGLAKSASNQSSRQSTKVPLKETDSSSSFGHRNVPNNSIRLESNVNLQDHIVDSQAVRAWGNSVSNEAIRAVGYGNSLPPVRDIQREGVRNPTDQDAVSENSMVDSISGVDISPDDVVGLIGQKHFWKARRAIVNQQRVFAVQVFELHRLIKVQRLIAGSPQLMVEDDAFMGKPAKISPIKKIPVEYVMKLSVNVPKLKDYREKPNDHTREFSSENAVEKVSLSLVINSNQSKSAGYPLPPSEPKMGSWGLNQPPGHQWLIPVMSPSEGLVYKPYPGPGYISPGPGPPGSAPVIGHNFVNYGVSPWPQPQYQWHTGFHPLVPPATHGCFPPYGMPMMNPSCGEEMNPFIVQYQSPCNVPFMAKFDASNDNEVQVSTASTPSNRTRDRNALPLYPTSPPAEGGPQLTRVIRVVPHNAQSATESVARIFQSIQEEKKQQDSV